MTTKITKPVVATTPVTSYQETPHVIRNRNHRMRSVHRESEVPEKLRTQQQFKDELDTNRIVQNSLKGVAPRYVNRAVAQYLDTSNVPDIAEAYNIIEAANDAFNELPAQLRLELGNDPANITSLTREQAERFKLLKQVPTPQPDSPTPPKAGQVAPDGTEPSALKAPKKTE